MNFSRIARQLNENESIAATKASEEKATMSGQVQHSATASARQKQKAQMSAQTGTSKKSDVSYASEEARKEREYAKMLANESSDWRKELIEAAGVDDDGNHPYVDVMPFMNQRQNEAKRQMKGAAKAAAGQQAQMMQPSAQTEGALNPFQVHFDKDGKEFTSKGSKEARERITRNRQEMAKRRAKDAYKPRAGESD